MDFIDTGIIIFSKVYSDKYYVVTIFTRTHGNMRFLTRKKCNLFSIVEITYRQNCEIQLSFVRFLDEESVIEHVIGSESKVLFLQNLCNTVMKVFPLNARYQKIFDFIIFIGRNINSFNDFACLKLLSHFELLLLQEAGFGLSLTKCCICGSIEDISFISSDSGHAVCKRCISQSREKLLLLPVLSDIMNFDDFGNINIDDIIDSLEISWHFIRKRIEGLDEYMRNRFIQIVLKVEFEEVV